MVIHLLNVILLIPAELFTSSIVQLKLMASMYSIFADFFVAEELTQTYAELVYVLIVIISIIILLRIPSSLLALMHMLVLSGSLILLQLIQPLPQGNILFNTAFSTRILHPQVDTIFICLAAQHPILNPFSSLSLQHLSQIPSIRHTGFLQRNKMNDSPSL